MPMLAPDWISLPSSRNGSIQDLQQLVRQRPDLRRIADVRHQQGEFIAAKPGEGVDRSHVRLQPSGD